MSDMMAMFRAAVQFLAFLVLATSHQASFGQASAPATAYTDPVAEPQPRLATQVERANADAVARLYEQIAAERVEGRLVGEIVDAAGGKDAVLAGLSAAQQIGGPRVLADDVVQIRLELAGSDAARLITRVVSARPENAGIAPERLTTLLAPWSDRTFRGTGASARPLAAVPDTTPGAAGSSPLVLPEQPPAWAGEPLTVAAVSPASGGPLRTARHAETAARAELRSRLGNLSLGGDRRLSDEPSLAESLDALADAAQIAGVDYRADGSVEVRVWIDGSRVWQTLHLRP